LFVVVAGLVSLAACSDYNLYRSDGLDVFYQNPVEEVDILLVVDNSCSMQPYQQEFGRNFDAFIDWFIDADVDYHIAVITTDPEIATAGEFIAPVITPETRNASEVFNSAVNVGTTGSGAEMGLETARLALSAQYLQTKNKGFIRDEAELSIIFTSDEEDGSPEPVNSYINTFFGVKGQRSRDVFNASALTVTNERMCTDAQAAASSPGTRYVDVATQTGGVIGDLCSDDYAAIVTELSLNASRMRDTFYLSQLPDPSSIEVGIDDELIPCDAGVWSYVMLQEGAGEVPAIVFETASLPPIDSRVEVSYDFGSGDASTFCPGSGDGGGR
jgi:hypothetical protein